MKLFHNLTRRFKRQDILLTIFVFSLSLIPLLWFKDNQILLGYDNVFPLNPNAFLTDRLYSWTSIQNFGFDQSGQQGSLISHFIDSFPQYLGFSYQASQKIVFSLWFFLMILASYLFVVRLEKYGYIKNSYVKYFLPVLYSINFYALQAWWVAERTKFSLMVATPIIFALLLPFAKESVSKRRIIIKSIVAALVLTVFNGGGWGGISLYGGVVLIIVSFFLFYSILFIFRKKYRSFINLFLFLIFLISFFVLFNAYTLLPFIFLTLRNYGSFLTTVGGINGLIGWTRYISEDTSFINILRLQGIPDWYNSIYHPYAKFYLNNNYLIVISFIFPVLILLSFLTRDKNLRKIMPYLITFFLLALFLTSGAHKPLGFIYEEMMRKIPGFIIFRSAFYKFGYSFWFIGGLLIAVSLSDIVNLVKGRFKNNLLPPILTIFIIALIVLYHFPFLNGDLFRIDNTNVSSRVELPSYVVDFSEWWRKNGNNEKVLLLPQLNNNWLFEQYRWHYLSLFPILGHFANTGLVENTDQLTPWETEFVNNLYSGINDKDYEKMDKYSSALGIRYFLIRKDFYHDIIGQNTDNPSTLSSIISKDPDIKIVKKFGEWDLYKYEKSKPLFSPVNQAKSFDGDISGHNLFTTPSLYLPYDVYSAYPLLFDQSEVLTSCLSCSAEVQELNVQIPKPKILIDSNIYDFVKLKEKIKKPKNLTYDQRVFFIVGEMLKNAGQMNELIGQDKADQYISSIRDKYTKDIKELSSVLKDFPTQAPNPYSTAVIAEWYLDAQNNYLSDLLRRTSIKSHQINTEKVLYEINRLNDRIKNFYSEKNFNKEKYYTLDIKKKSNFQVKIPIASLGYIDESEIPNIRINIDNKKEVKVKSIEGKYILFDKLLTTPGKHILKIFLPDQKNIISYTKEERLAGKVCYSSFVENFSQDLVYALSFEFTNNFDPSLLYFIDGGRVFSPVAIGNMPIAGNEVKKNRTVIGPNATAITDKTNLLRVSFCAPSLTENLFKENIKNLKVVLASKPEIILEENLNNPKPGPIPNVSFKKINQTKYKVYVKSASSPFFLVFHQRFSNGWVADVGDHAQGNGFENVWVVDKKGSYTIDVNYEPQKYFYLGAVISVVSIIASLFLVLFLLKRKR